MKHIKKVITLLISAVMVLAMSSAVFAANPEPNEFTGGAFSQTPETTISATGLTAGDKVEVYQLVKWDATASDWALDGTCGVALDELINGITEAEATTIAGTSGLHKVTDLTADENGEISYDCTDNPGLFYLKAIPAATNKDTVYNPAFVSADYYAGGNTVNFSDTIGSSTVVKKSTVPFDKEVTGADSFVDTKIGDVIPFKITTEIPSYGTSFVNPVFTITDTLSAGLTLEGDITVKYGNATTTETVSKVVTITKGTPDNGFTVAFDKEYLTGLQGETPEVEITYSAKVTTQALENVTYMDNKAKLEFSDTPTSTKDKEDITRHYTFSLDSNLNGGNHGGKRTRELIKIGVDDKNKTVTAFTSWQEEESWTTETPLAGAKFQLVGTQGQGTYTAESDGNGYISFKGLDAGTYTLTETEAPAGYIKDNSSHTVIITPTYTTGTDILESYTVSIDGNTSSYTITNMSDTDATVETTVDNSSMTFPFVNTKGSELPSTGGIGTVIFYTIGSLLVIGCGIVLVSRRRMQKNK